MIVVEQDESVFQNRFGMGQKMGQGVQQRRAALGWSQMDLAVRAGVSIDTVLNLEKGRNVHLMSLEKVITALEQGEYEPVLADVAVDAALKLTPSSSRELSSRPPEADFVASIVAQTTNPMVRIEMVKAVLAIHEREQSQHPPDVDPTEPARASATGSEG